MELTAAQRTRFNELLLETYKSFKSFCNAHQILFFAAGGTMIGAVRHGGMIPWDDDIDVYMFREDYERFLSLRQELETTNYEILDPTVPGYYCAMAKYSHRFSTLWEMEEISFVMGIYIDIFVLDRENGTQTEVLKRRMKYLKNADRFLLSNIQRSWHTIFATWPNIGKITWYAFQKLFVRSLLPYYKKKVLSFPKSDKGEWMVAYTGTSLQKDVFRAEWFVSGMTLFPFSDTTILVPNGFDAILRHMYGDYMELPPLDKQVSHHPHHYLNLERRISSADLKE